MDMRKLIDETDFDNLNELSKRWKKEPLPTPPPSHLPSQIDEKQSSLLERTANKAEPIPQKENLSQQSNTERVLGDSSSFQGRKRQVVPQIIDEDTQHFRNRLQHLLNTFKTDAVSEFMSMKRSMLDYQKETIKSDTQRYLTMYEEKHQELLGAKEKLISLTSEVERKTMQIELMSVHIAKLNQRIQITKHLSRPFALLYENAVNEKSLKVKMADAGRRDDRRLKMNAVTGWRNVFRQGKKEREEAASQSRVEMEVSQIVGRFQKEMETLREKLAEATRKNDEYENNKSLIQENLKKAFLRGISSMNMEAMGIFGGIDSQQKVQAEQPMNLSYVQPNHLAFSRNAPSNLNQTAVNIPTNSSVLLGKQKVESKDHKWREAPILGMEEKQEVEQPRMQLIRPTTEAKVIRVVDGRSNVDSTANKKMSGSVVQSRVEGGSKKKI